MLRLKEVRLQKYKCYNELQTVHIEDDITTIVGKNESGKTAFLEAIAKVNYFEDDENFKLNVISDFPRKELAEYKRKNLPETAIFCVFEIPNNLLSLIEEDLGEGVFTLSQFEYTIGYNQSYCFSNLRADEKLYLQTLYNKFGLAAESIEQLSTYVTIKSFLESPIIETGAEIITSIKAHIKKNIIEKSFKDWNNILTAYIACCYLKPNMPKFWYYDEYYALPSRINLNNLQNKSLIGNLNAETYKTAMALFDLANIELKELLNATDFESYLAELEATSNSITDKMFEYWTTNKNIEIKFEIDTLKNSGEKVLDIRVRNIKHRVTLPLSNRSKGFNWFFSFIVWFSKIQSSNNKNFILLLDEPGLNLHASAQADLLRFIDDLSKEYQIVYTTHSPFMIDSNNLQRTRTVLDTDKGTFISDAIKEKDTDTLFPLQAALGYDIAQNLFISKNNLLVEGPADLLYLTILSNLLESNNMKGLSNKFTIVPTGGLDKVTSFISLMKGNKLNVVCLLDSFNSNKGKQRLENLIQSKIIKEKNIHFFDEFTEMEKADIEDMFKKEEFLKIFNETYVEYNGIQMSHIKQVDERIIPQINQIIGKEFNHYRPANKLAQIGVDKTFFSDETLLRFEKIFITLNELLIN